MYSWKPIYNNHKCHDGRNGRTIRNPPNVHDFDHIYVYHFRILFEYPMQEVMHVRRVPYYATFPTIVAYIVIVDFQEYIPYKIPNPY